MLASANEAESSDATPQAMGRAWPLIRSRDHWLSEKQSRAALQGLRDKDQSSAAFADDMLAEEQASGAPLVAGNEVTLLTDGPTTYAAMLEAISKARRLILLESYIFDDDAVGARFAKALADRSKAGVTVAVMVDAVGTSSTPNEYFEGLRQAGIKITYFNSPNPLQRSFGLNLNKRDHRKLLVVDGAVGFTGGLNISGVYSSRPGSSNARRAAQARRSQEAPILTDPGEPQNPTDAEPTADNAAWRDTHVRIRGPAVTDMQRAFLQGWEEQGGDAIPNAAFEVSLGEVGAPGKDLVRIVTTSPQEGSAIYWTLLSAIGRAQHSVHITMGYFVPNHDFVETLTNAAQRGVDVQLVLPGFSDFWMVFHAGRAHYTELLESGVRIHERRDALLHAKTAVIDGIWSTVGSSNIDWRSFVHNEELNAIVLGPVFGKQMETLFQRDVKKAVPIMLDDWRNRSWTLVMRERIALLFAYWL